MPSVMASSEPPAADPVSLESLVFQVSPFGTAATAALVFALGAASFLLISRLAGYDVGGPSGLRLDRIAPGFVSPLLLATALGLRRYAEVKQRAEAPEIAAIVSGGTLTALLAPLPSAHMLGPSLAGAAAGAAVAFLSVPQAVWRAFPLAYAWQCGMIVVLIVLFARGVVMSARNWRQLRQIIERGLLIDLLHVDRLAVIGRQSARNALVWLVLAAIVCLYFVGGDPGLPTLPILLVCMAIGLWIFLHPMAGVRRRIQAAKLAELDRVRDEISEAVKQERRDPQAAARLPGLIAYEARVHAVREWPFDQSTLFRVATYILIPAIPWFGQAMAGEVIQRLGR
jgi:hypothetical protein